MTTSLLNVDEQEISAILDKNVDYINDLVGVGVSWDILAKPFRFGKLNMMSFVANGYFLTMNMVLILENLQQCIQDFSEE